MPIGLTNQKPQVVWFKRDLRTVDHEPLVLAAQRGAVLPLVVVEADYWKLPDVSRRQWSFQRACIEDLQRAMAAHGGCLSVYADSHADEAVIAALEHILSARGAFDLWSHQETGNAWTYRRDKAVARWCKTRGIQWAQLRTFGVVRGPLKPRVGWAAQWNELMSRPALSQPTVVRWQKPTRVDALPTAEALGLADDGLTALPPTGRAEAVRTLKTFLTERGKHYARHMSSPVTAADSCSRLSMALAYGSLSVREVTQAAWSRQRHMLARGETQWAQSIRAFVSRLHWHCHFIQKLESQPELEHAALSPACAKLRARPGDPALLQAFSEGRTGYPFVDAAMRYLKATGWINFRMRAMLMSFASYDLWLPWQESGLVLARLFIDYEPGIHWSQCQMQSGETGMNTLRMYSPVKQGFDQDPMGDFTRRWVPELATLPHSSVHEPWKTDFALGADPVIHYPQRVVDHAKAVASAKQRIGQVRRSAQGRTESERVAQLHGSKRRLKPGRRSKPGQGTLGF
jgi:deoxyribodipyrimidine photo-lyase